MRIGTGTRFAFSAVRACAALVACVCLVPGCGPEPETQPLPNVVLITLDTVRTDHMSCYGYTRNTTPNLDALAEESTLYTRAYTTAPWTLPTHASIFTGRHVHEHGSHRYKLAGDSIQYAPIPEDLPMLTTVFAELGYQTAAYIANTAYVTERYGFSRDFEHFRCNWMYAEPMLNYIRRWFDMRDERPFFLFVNLMDAHTPYNAEPRPGLLPEPPSQDPELFEALCAAVYGGDEAAAKTLRQDVIDQYDTAIAHLDEAVGDLLALLREHDDYDNTLVIVTTDHGELFGEGGLVGHAKGMLEPLLRAGLLVKQPGQTTPSVVARPFSVVGLPRLILDVLPEVTASPYVTRFPYRPDEHPILAENHYSAVEDINMPTWEEHLNRQLYAIYDWPWKYVHASDGQHQLYHLEGDPAEERNRVDSHPGVVQRLQEQLTAIRAEGVRDLSSTLSPEDTLTPEERKAMEALGYL